MKPFKFTKMHGLGNDFVVIDTVSQDLSLNPELIQSIADRRLGIGCDQVLVLGKGRDEADFSYSIYNADGSQAQHCGNGARCIAKYIHEQGLSDKTQLTLALSTHNITAEQISEHVIKIAMGQPEFGKPFTLAQDTVYPVNIGNPHAVIIAKHPPTNLQTLGEQFNRNPRFPEGVNVSWAIIKNPHHIALTVYERGVGFTLACGTAATATAAVALQQGWCEGEVVVSMAGGDCTVEWPQKTDLYLSGPAKTVFSGIWNG